MRMKSKTILTLVATCCAFAAVPVLTGPAHAEDASLTAKLHAMVDQLNTEQQAALYLLLTSLTGSAQAAAPAAAAEADLPAQFADYLAKFLEAARSENVDALMAMVSKDFYQRDVGDKDSLRGMLENVIDMGYIETYGEDIEFITDDAEFELEGDTLTVYPVDIETPMGGVTVEIIAQREDGAWKISGVEVY